MQDADIICSGRFGLEQKAHQLKNKFISLPYVSVSWYDRDKGKTDNLIVTNAPGSNKDAVTEWIIGMLVNLIRDLPAQINTQPYPKGQIHPPTSGLTGLAVCMLGAGNIGQQVGAVCQILGMNVSYFRRGDDLQAATKNANVVINCLSSNPDTQGLLDAEFFAALKPGTYFISIANNEITDTKALLTALDNNILAGAATDCGSSQVSDAYDPYYVQLKDHPKILATPHIAFDTIVSRRRGVDVMIDNIEAWLKGSPQNLV